MKHRRFLALVLVLALAAGVLSSAVSAADTDADSGATQKGVQEDTQQTKPAMQDGTAEKGTGRGRTGKAGAERTEEPEGAIGKDAAKEKALSDAGLSADQAGKVRATVSESEDGTVIYKVRFTCDGTKYSYQIDALTGKILDRKSEEAAEDGTEAQSGRGKRRGRQETAEPEGAVGKDAARAAALADAGLSADKAGKVRATVSETEDGTVIYKVRFTCDGKKYTYQVDALTGKILGKTSEEASESREQRTKTAKTV